MVRALCIRQPWTELILSGQKTIEVRSWATLYRGELWLHAGLRPDKEALQRFKIPVECLAFGALIGRCELYDCIKITTRSWARWRKSHLISGSLQGAQYAWFIRNPDRIDPRPFRGRLGLMRVDLPIEEHVPKRWASRAKLLK
ncbi:MAG: ASCH domain-containing protein [Acidobacteria bacterium]|nr:ASCH domain-containing protein [Acidobacteriota bacterium]